LSIAQSLSDFNGTYYLVNKYGDEGQFTPECTPELQVTYNSSENFLLGTFMQSNHFITGIRFKDIGQGAIRKHGDKGVYETTFSKNRIVETYEARSFFNSYSRVKSFTLQDGTLVIAMKSSDRSLDGDKSIDMECTYTK